VVFPATTDGFRFAVSALWSLDVKSGVNFHTYSLPEDRSVRLLIKNVGKRMHGGFVHYEVGSLGIRVKGMMQV
jgi:hypothetical protein